jgi:protein-S-isoprenylcysteine O-methyltransferase Ste14
VLRNAVFVLLVPGIVGGVLPWLITRYERREWGSGETLVAVSAAVLIAVGSAVLLHGVWRFAADGRGTPSPTAPTEHLVVAGPYRYVRNPMYLAVGAVIAGQALLFAGAAIVAYFVAFIAAVVLFVKAYEEPTLTRTFGDEYLSYRARVPGWWPRRER